jgi:hypothetical protein
VRIGVVAVGAVALGALLAGCTSTTGAELAIGDCFTDGGLPDDGGSDGDEGGDTTMVGAAAVDLVDCDEPHDNEVFAMPALDDGDYPGQAALDAAADERCLARFADYVGIDYGSSRYVISHLTPTPDRWQAGDRDVVCILSDVSFASVTGSARDSGQ